MSDSERILIASNNPGKLREFRELFSALNLSLIAQSELNIEEAEENGLSFVENAIIKARHAAASADCPVIADDSGIEVDVLGGQPGIHSARYAGSDASDEQNVQLLLENVKKLGEKKPAARFQCVMVYLRHQMDPVPLIAQGTWEGYLVDRAQGENGFGYDPVFYVPDHGCTSAQLDASVKNNISHRGQALRLLLEKLNPVYSRET